MTATVESVRAGRGAGHSCFALVALFALFAVACSDKQLVLGEQCPSPRSGRASVEGPMDGGPADVYGTSCAPCDQSQPRFDARGCPIFVTFESCGGDICLAGRLILRPLEPDAGADAGEDGQDAGR